MIFRPAYIDPGTGSVILQAIIGAIAGIAYAVRHRIAVIWGKITGKPSRREAKPTLEKSAEAKQPK